MARSKPAIPKQTEALVEFFDSQDMGDYWDDLPEAQFEIDLKRRRHLVAIDENLIAALGKLARSKKTTAEKLINTWVREKLHASK